MSAQLCVLVLLAFGSWVSEELTIDEIGYTDVVCESIRNDVASYGFIPCPCRVSTGNAHNSVPCFPNCCPRTGTFEGDRCHMENKLTWSVYEQQVCEERPPKEYFEDVPNCFYRGNIPIVDSATTVNGVTQLHFQLSTLPEHYCNNLYIAVCLPSRSTIMGMFFVNTTDSPPQKCWLRCSPEPIAPCTATSCLYHRGETNAVIHTWTIPAQLAPGDYALVCKTLVKGIAVGSTLYQEAFAQIGFKIL